MSDLSAVIRHEARGMLTLRGDLSSAAVKKAVKAACGQGVPRPGFMTGSFEAGVAWMSPDELLIMVPYGEVAQALADMEKALKGAHALVADVSDARAVFTLKGEDAAEVLARLCPAELAQMPVGAFRRSRMAQVAAAFGRHEDGFDVVCFRSVGDYADMLLRNAAHSVKVGAL